VILSHETSRNATPINNRLTDSIEEWKNQLHVSRQYIV